MRISSVLAVLLAVTAAGCTKFEIRSTRSAGVPPALLGEWQGNWDSQGAGGQGVITVRVQEFDGDPVVAVVLDNPCIVPQAYELVFVGGGIELRAAGATVLRAELAGENRLAGTYTCALDSGSWTAAWQGDLPEILDLSGEWIGEVDGSGGSGDDLLIHLGQAAQGGTVLLQGALQLPGFMALPVPVFGHADFREQDFDVVLTTPSGVFPAIEMIGIGDARTLAVENGVMLISGGVVVPFASGVWTATQTPQ